MRTFRAAIMLTGILASLTCSGGANRRTLRIGTNYSPDFNYYDEQKRPAGFGIEVMNLAAERAGYRLEWVITKEGPEPAFRAGLADLWPVVTYYEKRKQEIHLTEPWWRLAAVMYSREDSNIKSLADLANRRLVLTSPSRRYLPDADFHPTTQIETVELPAAGMRMLCRGETDAAWMDFRVMDQVLLNRPKECEGVRLASSMIAQGTRAFSIGARHEFRKEADRLRAAIDDLALSGELLQLAAHWKFVDQTDTALISWLNTTRQRNEMWRLSVTVLLVSLLASLILVAVLQEGRKKAQASARARAQFLANMSHELRTPMNGVLGMTELTLSTDLSPEQRDYLGMARESAQRLLVVLNDILDLSRVESGKLRIEDIPFAPRDVVQRSVLMLSLQAQEKALVLEDRIAPGVPGFLRGDPSRLQQVLINLLGNAIKFTDQGSVSVVVNAELAGHGRYVLEFQVRDTGLGIPKSQHKRIFEAFTQADASTTRRFGGTGLGLAISAQLVRMMNGTITVDSEPGKGSTFLVRLPFTVAAPTAEVPAVTPLPLRPLHILVAEDNLVNRMLVERSLTKAGHKVRSVEDGIQAIRVLKDGEFDAVLMDVHMPNMDGLEATRRIREEEARHTGRRIPIIALTALAVRGDAERCLAAGMDDYVAKPFRPDDLMRALARIDEHPVR